MRNIKDREKLNQVTHSIRASQAVLQYGVGAMVDFPDQTLLTAAPEYWRKIDKVFDERLAKTLNVLYFGIPKENAYVRFPRWYFCPQCRKFQTIDQWQQDYYEKYRHKDRGKLNRDKYMIRNMKGPSCNQDLVVARIVTVCENGHLNDFPWVEWLHVKAHKSICRRPSLKFKTGTSSSEGLEGLVVSCSCGASSSLQGIFNPGFFENLDEKMSGSIFTCPGHHPFKNTTEACSLYPKTIQRGSSSIYFPVVRSSLVIPPFASDLNKQIEQSSEFNKCLAVLENEETAEGRERVLERDLSKWTQKISNEIAVDQNSVKEILVRKFSGIDEEESDFHENSYKADEYLALTGRVSTRSVDSMGDFSRQPMDISQYNLPHIKAISLIDKVRVVNAHIGFSRLNPVNKESNPGFVSVKEADTCWYPAYEVRGEGIFIEFNDDDIDAWVRNNPSVVERVELLNENKSNSFLGRQDLRKLTPKFVMLHTLSHLLISELSFECGYNVASLAERLYCSNSEREESMSGIFIYTASGDAEGTLGGLVRQGHPDTFPRIFKKAIADAEICSNDPVCITSRGQGRDSLNLAACYACGLLPETSCEERNVYLDRALIVGTLENRAMGFWSDLL